MTGRFAGTACRVLAALPLLLLASAAARAAPRHPAQSRELQVVHSFEELNRLVRPGDTLTVLDTSGVLRTGRVASVFSKTLDIEVGRKRLSFPDTRVRRVM